MLDISQLPQNHLAVTYKTESRGQKSALYNNLHQSILRWQNSLEFWSLQQGITNDQVKKIQKYDQLYYPDFILTKIL